MPKRGFLYSLPPDTYYQPTDNKWHRSKERYGDSRRSRLHRRVFDWWQLSATMYVGRRKITVSTLYNRGWAVCLWSNMEWSYTVGLRGKTWPEVLRYAESLLRLSE